MPHRHPEPLLLEKFLRGEATTPELQALVWHLLEACPDCAAAAGVEGGGGQTEVFAATVGAEVAQGAPGFLETGDDAVVEQVRCRIQPKLDLMVRAQREAPGLLDELQRHPLERQRLLIRNNPRFHNLPLADVMLEAAWERRLRQPAESEGMVVLALDLLDQIDATVFGEALVNDLRGRAWAYRGNLFRIQSALREADEAFRRAEGFLEEGTGDPLEAARLLGLKATLRRSQMRLPEASGMIQESFEIYEALGEHHLAGRTMVTQALLLYHQGEPAAALEVLGKAQSLIDPERDPYLLRVVQQNLVVYLTEVGRYEEAMALIPALRHRVVEGGNRIELLRLRWQEGKLLLSLGHESRAEAAFLEVRKGFVEQGIAHDAALVSLELASLYLRQGRTAEIRELTGQMVPIFQSRDLHQSVVAALLLFQQAVERDALTLRLIEEVGDVVRRGQKPGARTEEPS